MTNDSETRIAVDWEFEKSKTYGTGYCTACAKCPYFRNHAKREIHCMSAYEMDAVMILRFRSAELKDRHRRIWCNDQYTKCEWYRTMQAMTDPEG